MAAWRQPEQPGLLYHDGMSAKLTNYFDCYNSDAVCGTTNKQIDDMIAQLEVMIRKRRGK